MADYTITATSVVTTETSRNTKLAGETITAGQALYLHTDGKVYKAQNDGTAAQADVVGIALNGGAAGQPISYLATGALTVGAALGAAGAIIILSATAGGLAPFADLASTNYLTIVGYSTSASAMVIDLNATGVQKP